MRTKTQSGFEQGVRVKSLTTQRARTGNKTEIVVTVEEQQFESGCARLTLIQELTPYSLAEIDGTQEVVFKHVTKSIPCRSYVPHM
ncbi:MAG TPA: hypothetical protein VFC63_23710 [Blastocatellia bacterium]|nr:hypothetical protein [Blastocatellia bacterium]